VTPGFDGATLDATAEAVAKIDARISFVQSDLVGHLLCQFPVHDRPISARASVGPDQVVVSARIEEATNGKLALATDELEVAFSLRPRPVEALFGQNPDLNITCAGAAGLAWLGSGLQALGVKNLPDAFTGDFKQRIDALIVPVSLPMLDIPVPGTQAIRMKPILRPAGLVLEDHKTR
jgi:hypothetical protein